ncbi:MAG TPA: cbb3-type cytochrome c oxidase subunit 3 [Gammaproteobacteria bacterium]|nr:cbb3-type cytochrome c oxidase subunit 3 [Gammaproteobacteria bacterium]
MNFGLAQGIWTIIVLIVFVGIVIWAWSGKRKKHFDEAARIPFDEDRNKDENDHDDESNNR